MTWGSSSMEVSVRVGELLGEVIPRQRRTHVGAREEELHDDLHRRVAAEAAAADGRTGGLAPLAVDRHEKVGGAVDDARLIVEAGGGVDEAREVHDLLHAIEVAEGVF